VVLKIDRQKSIPWGSGEVWLLRAWRKVEYVMGGGE